jgi:hypothetical protein
MHAKAVAATAIFPGLICSFSVANCPSTKAASPGCSENVALEVRFQAPAKLVQKMLVQKLLFTGG